MNSAHSKHQCIASVTSVDTGQISKDFYSKGCIVFVKQEGRELPFHLTHTNSHLRADWKDDS